MKLKKHFILKMENITTYLVELTGMTNKTLGSHHVKTYNKMKDKAIFMKNFRKCIFSKNPAGISPVFKYFNLSFKTPSWHHD